MSFAKINAAAEANNLSVIGAFHPRAEGGSVGKTLILLGPREPGFWATITASAEYAEGEDPVDRWSRRIINDLAKEFSALALYPFGGPPHQPFVGWALASGQVWQSPVGLLVHDVAGLFLSMRGALAFERTLALPDDQGSSPCLQCAAKPCLDACPAGALGPSGYDVPACHTWLDEIDGKTCLSGGCLVRRSCPVSQTYGRLEEQSAHHMRFFHKG